MTCCYAIVLCLRLFRNIVYVCWPPQLHRSPFTAPVSAKLVWLDFSGTEAPRRNIAADCRLVGIVAAASRSTKTSADHSLPLIAGGFTLFHLEERRDRPTTLIDAVAWGGVQRFEKSRVRLGLCGRNGRQMCQCRCRETYRGICIARSR